MNEDLVCPLDWRYGSKEMRSLFSHESIIRRYAEVELALIKALSHIGLVKEDEVKDIEKAVKDVRADEVDELEKKIGHDIMALATLIAEKSGDAGRFVHFGATSYDIVDTAYALIFRDALGIIKGKLKMLIIILSEYSIKYKNTIMVGRTHGQHALPITLGFKFANYVYELSRSYERLTDAEKRLIKGKMSGAVGTMAGWGEHALEVEKHVMDLLNLNPHEISTQVAPRDGHAEIILDLAILASQLDRLALEIRELMRPEILELAEGVGERVGSSTMPHKENPVTAEKISGLAKVARALSISVLENIPLWHERDLTNSSSERIIISHQFLMLDEILDSAIELLKNLRIYEDNMRRNLELTKGVIMAESLMINLTLKGMKRHEAHKLASELAKKARVKGKDYYEVCKESEVLRKYFSEDELKKILDPANYLGMYSYLINRALGYASKVLNADLLKIQI